MVNKVKQLKLFQQHQTQTIVHRSTTRVGRRTNISITGNVNRRGACSSNIALQITAISQPAELTAHRATSHKERRPLMSNEQQRNEAISSEELDAQNVAELPDREAMSLINANIAVPVNAAVSANVLSDGAIAIADATQDATIDQST